jgi:hypothetical protein
VWEVARVLREVRATADEVTHRTAERTDLTTEQVRIVLRFYAKYRDEVDAWIERVDEEAARAEDAWHREQQLLGT